MGDSIIFRVTWLLIRQLLLFFSDGFVGGKFYAVGLFAVGVASLEIGAVSGFSEDSFEGS